jgi:hypothetical protein
MVPLRPKELLSRYLRQNRLIMASFHEHTRRALTRYPGDRSGAAPRTA